MRKALVLGLVTAVLFLSLCTQNTSENMDQFSVSQTKPQPGNLISVFYNPSETELKDSEQVSLIAYSYSQGLPEAKELVMRRTNGIWKAAVSVPKESRGVLIKFQDEDTIDNNEKTGYVIHLYNEEGNAVPGTFAGLAEAYSGWAQSFLDVEISDQEVKELFEKDFSQHPELKKEYVFHYLRTLSKTEPEEDDERILKELDQIISEYELNAEQLSPAATWYENLEKPDKAEQIKALIREKDPRGDFVQSERFMEFYRTEDIDQKRALLQKFQKSFPKSENLSMWHSYLCRALSQKGEFEKIDDYVKKHPEAESWNMYNSVASEMAEQKQNLELAEEFASRAVKLARSEINDPSEEKPSYYTEEQWKETRERYLSYSLDTYGTLLLQQGKPQQAQDVLREAVRLTDRENSEFNEHYAEALVAAGDLNAALNEMKVYLESGNSTSVIKELFVTARVQQGATEEEAQKELEQLEGKGEEILKAEIRKEMIDIPAPEFELKNLEGESVSLSGLKGKVLVLDFWATWCGPCITSFPGMKIVVETYKEDDSVEILFVDSWERVEDWKSNAQDFLKENNYPFHVLLDTENEVIDSYKVSGIPTKFFIDREGRIRFKSVGFDGNTEKLVKEVSLIIEMLK
ncbi:MAG: redoxin domain-containing protein [Candidatus Aminicenantes bacterium]|nr:redoxin domain-containing protein [Candidatus Aminicenantes bacterium]